MTKFINCSEEAKETKKETVFTHVLNDSGCDETNAEPEYFEKVVYLFVTKVHT